jgi:hypothetical protein
LRLIILKTLRDPLWQFIGALLALFALLIPWYQATQSGEMRIVLAWSSRLYSEGRAVPGVSHKTEIDGVLADNSQTVAHIFVVENKSNKAFVPSESNSPLRITPREGSPLLKVHAFPTIDGAPEIQTQKNTDGTWTILLPVMNPDQTVEITTYGVATKLQHGQSYVERNAIVRDSAPTVFWQVPNVKTNVYKTADQIPYTAESFNPLNISVYLSGKDIPQVLAIFTLIFYISTLTISFWNRTAHSQNNTRLLIVAASILSISAAESLHHLFVRSAAVREVIGTHPANYVVILVWALCHAFFAFRAIAATSNLALKGPAR